MNENQDNVNAVPASIPTQPDTQRLFNNPEEYKKVTGRRFRMNAEQKARVDSGEISRQQAFDERYDELAEQHSRLL